MYDTIQHFVTVKCSMILCSFLSVYLYMVLSYRCLFPLLIVCMENPSLEDRKLWTFSKVFFICLPQLNRAAFLSALLASYNSFELRDWQINQICVTIFLLFSRSELIWCLAQVQTVKTKYSTWRVSSLGVFFRQL